jgi:hypothetical protein
VRGQVREQLVRLGDPRADRLFIDEDRAAAELLQLDRGADRHVEADALREERPADLVPRRIGGRLCVEPPGDDGGEVGERLQQHVVGALPARGSERDVRRGVGRLFVARAPLRLGQIHGGRGEIELAVAATHRPDGAAQALQSGAVAALLQQHQAIHAVDLLGEVAQPARERHALEAVERGAGSVGVAVQPQAQERLAEVGEQLVHQ